MIRVKTSPQAVPIGTIIFIHTGLYEEATLANHYVACDGSTISDSSSPLNGLTLPDMNGGKRLLRGDEANKGTTGGSATHFHNYTWSSPSAYSTQGSGSDNNDNDQNTNTSSSSSYPKALELKAYMRFK